MPTSRSTVRLAPHAQQWLTAYTAARPHWDRIENCDRRETPPATLGAGTVGGERTPDSIEAEPLGHAASPPVAPEPLMWQAIREVRQVSVTKPLRTRTDIVAAVADSTGIAPTRVAAAIAYWADHPDEVTARLHG